MNSVNTAVSQPAALNTLLGNPQLLSQLNQLQAVSNLLKNAQQASLLSQIQNLLGRPNGAQPLPLLHLLSRMAAPVNNMGLNEKVSMLSASGLSQQLLFPKLNGVKVENV